MALVNSKNNEKLEKRWKSQYTGYCTLCKKKILHKKKAKYLTVGPPPDIRFSGFLKELEYFYSEVGWLCEKCLKKIKKSGVEFI